MAPIPIIYYTTEPGNFAYCLKEILGKVGVNSSVFKAQPLRRECHWRTFFIQLIRAQTLHFGGSTINLPARIAMLRLLSKQDLVHY